MLFKIPPAGLPQKKNSYTGLWVCIFVQVPFILFFYEPFLVISPSELVWGAVEPLTHFSPAEIFTLSSTSLAIPLYKKSIMLPYSVSFLWGYYQDGFHWSPPNSSSSNIALLLLRSHWTLCNWRTRAEMGWKPWNSSGLSSWRTPIAVVWGVCADRLLRSSEGWKTGREKSMACINWYT